VPCARFSTVTGRRRLGPARLRALRLAYLATVCAVLAPAVLAVMLHHRYLEWDAERVTSTFSQNLAWRAREVLLHAERELDRLVERTGGRCTPDNIRAMLDTAYRAIVVREAGIFAGGRLLCTSWGPLPEPPRIPDGNDRIVAGERVIIPSVRSLLGLAGRSASLNASADDAGTVGVNVLIPREVFTAGFAPAGRTPESLRAAILLDDGVLGAINLTDREAAQLVEGPVETVFPDADFVVRRAEVSDGIYVLVALRRDELWRDSLDVAVPTLAAAFLAAGLAFFTQRRVVRRRFSPLAEFPAALADRELVYDCEPIIRLDDQRPVGFEMLARWDHPVHGRLGPSAFLSALESPRNAATLTLYAVDAAIEALARRDGLAGYASINITATALDDLRWLERAADRLAASGRGAGDIQFELTERHPLDLRDPARLAALWRVRAAGFRVALDDFGCGGNGLDALALGRFDQVKIDRGFVDAMRLDPRARIIVRTMAELARQLATDVVAEGVERDEQIAVLLEAGVTLGQGFLFRPAVTDPG